MEYSAICHFGDKRYCFALEKGRFLFRIRVKKGDVKRVVLHYRDKYLPLDFKDTRAQADMRLAASDRFFDYYEAEITFSAICLRYYFEIEDNDGECVFYGNYEFSKERFDNIERMFDCPQNLREEEMFLVPNWAKNKVVYQIFPSRFATDKSVDKELWYSAPIDNTTKLGGNLRGIINKLEYLKELGVDIIYMTPIFKAETQHKYDTEDYFEIDPSFGTKEDLKELVDKAHAIGMFVITDAVFNHTSTKFFAFADIVEKGKRSEYLDWYFIEGFPLVTERERIPNFKSFAYYWKMPKLNLKNPKVEDYFIEVGKYWIKECGIDGWRLDVADEIGHKFWKRFRDEIRKENPDALIVGEEWHFAGDYLEGDEWDSVMNYPFFNAVSDLVAEEKITASEFMGDLGFLRGNLHNKVYPLLWNMIDSHDTPRFLHIVNNNKTKQRFAAALQLLLPGMPMIYYGDEYAMDGAGDPDCRRGMLWDEEYQDKEMFNYYKKLISLRHEYPCITEGDITEYRTDDENGIIAITSELDGNAATVLFHCKNGTANVSEYAGKTDLIGGKAFDGKMEGWTAALIMDMG